MLLTSIRPEVEADMAGFRDSGVPGLRLASVIYGLWEASSKLDESVIGGIIMEWIDGWVLWTRSVESVWPTADHC